MLTNITNSVIYIGVTSDLLKRVWQHKNKIGSVFTSKYNANKLVYYESYNDMEHAIQREKQLKAGSRKRKITLVEKLNPKWKDLYNDII